MLMVMFMKANGTLIKLRVTGYIPIWMEHSIKDRGKKTSNMERAKRHGLMELCMKETIFKEKSRGWACLSGLMGLYMMASLTIITSKEKDSTAGLMDEHLMELGKETR